jgi:hypothetical protein
MKQQSREQTQRDLHPHKGAVAAMWIWHQEYAQQSLGSMGFWDSLSESRKKTAWNAVRQIEKAAAA